MEHDEAAGNFPPPDSDEDPTADEPDPAFGETDDEEPETPDADEPDADESDADELGADELEAEEAGAADDADEAEGADT